jgi:RHS repeat-associated protein
MNNLEAVAYDARGSIVSMTLANGVVEERKWDALGRLSNLALSTPNQKIRDSAFTYDGRGNIESVEDEVAAQLRSSYAYDDLSRLTDAKIGERAFSYAYALDGNLGQVDGKAVAYDSLHPHAPKTVGNATFEYGPAGQLVQWASSIGVFDAKHKLRKVTGLTGTTDYVYDAVGNLAVKTDAKGKHLFVSKFFETTPEGEFLYAFLGDSRLAKFQTAKEQGGCASAGQLLVPCLLALGGMVFLRKRKGASGLVLLGIVIGCKAPKPSFTSVTYFHHDPVGSTQLTTDANGKPSGFSTYSPFGESLQKSTEHYGFAGKYNDEATGLSFWPMRQLAVSSGRWNAPDVHALENAESLLAEPQGLNVYAYAANNPIRFQDKQGNFQEPIHGALTYHLAMAAGFTQSEAKTIALACAGMDHDPATRPVGHGPLGFIEGIEKMASGMTEMLHFQSHEQAAQNISVHRSARWAMDLTMVGKDLHTLEDVGFVDALGPHMRGTPSAFMGWVFGKAGGHPDGWMEDGTPMAFWNSNADIPYHSPNANEKLMTKVYVTLVELQTAKSGQDKSGSPVAALELIRQAVNIRTPEEMKAFLAMPGVGGAKSYNEIVDDNYRQYADLTPEKVWKSKNIDNDIK